MSEDSPVESDEENSERIKDGRVNDEDNERRGQPTPRRRGIESRTEDDVSNPEHAQQNQHERHHEYSQ